MSENWTSEQTELLTNNYKLGARHCSGLLNKTVKSVQIKANRLGLHYQAPKNLRDWADEEDQFLLENYKKLGREGCAKELDRSIHSIKHRAALLDIKVFDKNIVSCKQCNKQFHRRRGTTKKYKLLFCSQACQTEYFRKNSIKGPAHPKWQGNRELRATDMGEWQYKNWKIQVFTRDKRTCQICSGNKKKINAHHIKSYEEFPSLRYILANGITLCVDCHKRIHRDEFSVLSPFDAPLLQFKILNNDVRDLIKSGHYSQSVPIAPKYMYGLFWRDSLIGGCIFARPSRQGIKADLELARFYLVDGLPKNTASFFLGGCLKLLKKEGFTGTIVSYADPTEGHQGTIYKATNWTLDGKTSVNYHYEKADGQRVHKRQVWNRARTAGIPERELAETEGLIKMAELPKLRYLFKI